MSVDSVAGAAGAAVARVPAVANGALPGKDVGIGDAAAASGVTGLMTSATAGDAEHGNGDQ